MPRTTAKKAPTSPPPHTATVQAVIFLSADALSMMVTELRSDGSCRVLDVLSQPVNLAQDVFGSEVITRDTMDRCVHIVQGFNDLLAEYRLAGAVTVRLLATNILLDIRNMDTLVNRMQIACGLQLEVMDDGEMTRLLYLKVQRTLARHPELSKKRVLVLHVGPGNTRLLVFDKGRITYYANYRIGAHRTGIRIADAELSSGDNEIALIREHIRGTVGQMHYDVESAMPSAPDVMLIFGPDFRQINSPLAQGDHVSPEALSKLGESIAKCPLSQRMVRYGVDYAGVTALLPTVGIYSAVVRAFQPHTIICPPEERAHAFLMQLMPSGRDDTVLEDEVIHFTQLLAARYRTDRGHSAQIRKLCTALFDRLQELHQLTRHDRLVLKVAAILHEIGTYISPKNHHLHGQYIILNSEIFGLSRRDVEVVGLLSRYHRQGSPIFSDRSYAELPLADRLRVQKLTALLRVAEAMEHAHSHRINDFTVRFNNRRLELLVSGVRDLAVENHTLRDKGQLFTDIFGYDIVLIPAESTY